MCYRVVCMWMGQRSTPNQIGLQIDSDIQLVEELQ